MVGARDRLFGELVEAQGQPLCKAAVVDEDDRRAVLPDEIEQRGIDRRPDRARRRLVTRAHRHLRRQRRLAETQIGARLAHVLQRDDHLEIELLPRAGVDELDRPATGDEPSYLLEWALGGREPDALKGPVGSPFEALEREREMGAALRAGDGVDLVDDHRLDPAQHLPTLRGQQQIERLGVVIRMSGGVRSIWRRSF